jgi:hypothetical protein
MMENASTIISREVRSKLLCPRVDEKVAIPGVIRGNVEEVFVGKIRVDEWTSSVGGKRRDEFEEHECFISFRSLKL